MIERLRAAQQQHGQVMILFGLMLPVLLGMMGLGIDVGYLFKERRQLQNVADLAALAGASQLPGDPDAAEAVAEDTAADNGVSSSEFSAVGGYDDDDTKIEVTLSRNVDLFFMPVLGIDSVAISARAVAAHNPGMGASLFAKKDTHCWEESINWYADNLHVAGSAHSNSGMTFDGDGNTLDGSLTYKDGPPVYPMDGWTDCEPHVRMWGSNPDIPEPEGAPWQDWPVMYSASDFPCTYEVDDGNLSQDGPWWVDGQASSKLLNPGVICSGSTWLTMDGTDVSGNVTFRSPRIDFRGSNFNLTPYQHDVLFYATGDGWPAMELEAIGGTWEGMIFCDQDCQVRLTGYSGFDLKGSIVAWAIDLRGNNWQISGNIENDLPEPMRLVE